MNKNEFLALALVVLAEIFRGTREAIHEIQMFVVEYLKNPDKFWRHLQRAAICMMLCTFALAPAYFYLTELLKHQA